MGAKLLLMVSVVFAASGQVLFKKGMNILGEPQFSGGILNIIKTLFSIIFSPIVFGGLLLYVSSTVLWLLALSKVELNVAYPFTALTFVLVMAASYFLFSEHFSVNQLVGGGVICVGIIITSIK